MQSKGKRHQGPEGGLRIRKVWKGEEAKGKKTIGEQHWESS